MRGVLASGAMQRACAILRVSPVVEADSRLSQDLFYERSADHVRSMRMRTLSGPFCMNWWCPPEIGPLNPRLRNRRTSSRREMGSNRQAALTGKLTRPMRGIAS